MFLEKKDHKKIMLEAKYKVLHLSALDKGNDKKAQEWLDRIEELKS
jgi:hypothetical protein